MRPIERLHEEYVFARRVRRLSDHLVPLIPKHARVLDVGCGNGLLARLIAQQRPDINVRGIDVLVRDQTLMPVERFDGQAIPFSNKSFDVVMLIDVLHHTEEPLILLHEAVRVTRKTIVIKDHTRNGLLADLTLRCMDWIGNNRYGVIIPYNYWTQQQWLATFQQLGVTIDVWKKELRLYPRPADWIFGRSLHFIARLDMC